MNKLMKATFGRDERGNTSLVFAVGMTVIAGVIGAALDFSMAGSSKSQSQQIADTLALNAAIFVKNEGRVPESQEEGGLPEGQYKAGNLGFDFNEWVVGSSNGVDIDIDYNDADKEVIVTVAGRTETSFSRIFGINDVGFRARSIVSYLEMQRAHPASIALVLDNSGSMAWDDKFATSSGASPANAVPRIEGLEETVNDFMADLEKRLGTQTSDGFKFIRTGMIPYNEAVIATATNDAQRSGVVPMDWDYLDETTVDKMEAWGATNSSPPMTMAWDWLQDEVEKHDDEADRAKRAKQDPLRFVIFMTDGQNTAGNYMLIEDDSTGKWYADKCIGSRCGWWVSGYQYDSDFKEGYLQLASDQETLDACRAMQADSNPVKIFSIGYALQPGLYNANKASDPTRTEEVTVGMQATAHGLLAGCATDSTTMFIEADNAEQLQSAFDEIQNAIVEELIRIKQ